MKNLYDVARKLRRYPQVTYDQTQEMLRCQTSEYEVTYQGNQITIHMGGKIYEHEVADLEEGYFFFRWLLRKKILLKPSENGFSLTVRNYRRLVRRKLQTKPAGIVRRLIIEALASPLILYHLALLYCFPAHIQTQQYIGSWDIVSLIAFVACIVIAVLLIVHVNRKHPMRVRDVLKIIFGAAMLCGSLSLSAASVSTWFETSDVSDIALILLFLPFGAIGVWLIVNAFLGGKRNADITLVRKPQFPPLEQAQALWEQILADSPEVVILSRAETQDGSITSTSTKIGGEMYAAERTSPLHVYEMYEHENDTELFPVLQLNLADLPENNPLSLPKKGLLQLFISAYDGDLYKLLYYQTFDTLGMGRTSTFAIDEIGRYDNYYAWGEIPICVDIRKTLFYHSEKDNALMRTAAEKLGIALSEDLSFRELAVFLHQTPKAYPWLGVISSEGGDLSITLVAGHSADGSNGLELGGEEWMTWQASAQELEEIGLR